MMHWLSPSFAVLAMSQLFIGTFGLTSANQDKFLTLRTAPHSTCPNPIEMEFRFSPSTTVDDAILHFERETGWNGEFLQLRHKDDCLDDRTISFSQYEVESGDTILVNNVVYGGAGWFPIRFVREDGSSETLDVLSANTLNDVGMAIHNRWYAHDPHVTHVKLAIGNIQTIPSGAVVHRILSDFAAIKGVPVYVIPVNDSQQRPSPSFSNEPERYDDFHSILQSYRELGPRNAQYPRLC